MQKVLIFIVTYNAEKTIEWVLSRIPDKLFEDPRYSAEVLIIDDCSRDETFGKSWDVKQSFTKCPLTILKNPKNLGYGGNQKVGYNFALKNGFDFVALVHGDGQYAPEELPNLLEPLLQGKAEAVFGSRMLRSKDALKGGMPYYKFVGNKILTTLENLIVGTRLSEYHSGYRLYSCAALKRLPFEYNSSDFDFDTDIIIQLHSAGCRISEIPIPTYYGEEECHVNGIRYGLQILASCLRYRVQKLGILYEPKFDTEDSNLQYKPKFDFASSHSYALESIEPQEKLLILGCGPADLVKPFMSRASQTSVADLHIPSSLKLVCKDAQVADLDSVDLGALWSERKFDRILALDVIEHLKSPEDFLTRIRNSTCSREARLVITTPNVAFLPIRLMLLGGFFNYGKRGILDRTHTRLFTRGTLRKILEQCGFEVLASRGVPAPFPLAIGRGFFGNALLALNKLAIKLFPSLFSYQLYVECKPKPTVDILLERAIRNSESELERLQRSAANG